MENDHQRIKTERYVAISCALHTALFLSFLIGSALAPKPITYLPTVQVDVVALPSQVKNNDAPTPDLTKPVKPNAPEPVPAEPAKSDPDQLEKPEKEAVAPKTKAEPKVDDMALERKKEAEAKKRADAALKRMREMLKKERQQEDEKKQAALEKRRADLKAFEQKYRQAINGNQKNEGTSLTGQQQATLNAYLAAVTDQIRSNWALPSFLQSQGLAARIVIHIDGRGNVVKMEFTRTSGNTVFDNNAEGAIRNANPFPPPPADMASGLRNSGIEVKFPL